MKSLLYIFIFFIFFTACSKEHDYDQESTENNKEEEVKELNNESDFNYESLIQSTLECMNMARPTDSYNYPAYPGMSAWADFKTSQEMFDACQVPEGILKNISTHAVIQAIWEYPFLFDVIHRNEYQYDFRSMLKNNAHKELSKRVDAGKCLLERMRLADPLISYVEPKVFELIISQTVFLSQLDDNEKKEVILLALKNDKLINEPKQQKYDRAVTWLLTGRVMINANYAPFLKEVNDNEGLNLFFESILYDYFEDHCYDFSVIINNHAKSYLK